MQLHKIVAVLLVALPSLACAETAEEILKASGVKGGVIVHLGCGDGSLTANLRVNERCLVQGLEATAEDVAKARATVHAKGCYGPVSVIQYNARSLPYPEHMVNLIVVGNSAMVSEEEMMRVLVPNGAIWSNDGQVKRKPWPKEIDQWTHFLHDATNDCTAKDTRVGPPQRMIWHCGPEWTRSHEYSSSMVALVSAQGRVYYLFDEGLTGVTPASLPERWTLNARDAFNGVLLWKKPVKDWRRKQWTNTSLRGIPPSVPRLLVCEGDRVFTPLGLDAPVSILDGATGEVVATCEGSDAPQELRCCDGVLLVVKKGSLTAYGAADGKERWSAKVNVGSTSLAAANGKAFYQVGKSLVCLDLKTGKELWKSAGGGTAASADKTQKGKKAKKRKGGGGAQVIVCDESVIYNGPNGLTAVATSDGKVLWSGKGRMNSQAFISNGKLWQGGGPILSAIDLKTGENAGSVDAKDVFTDGHHPRCHQGKATVNYAITPNRGIEFVSLTGQKHTQHDWARGPCRYGIMPANGLLYVPPHPCFCYAGVKLTGFNAMAGGGNGAAKPGTGGRPIKGPAHDFPRLVKGPAYGDAAKLVAAKNTGGDWLTYRHDGRRTGAAKDNVSAQAAPKWNVKLKAPLTQPIVAGEHLYVAAKNEHVLYSLNRVDGTKVWQFFADGRIDSPPTVYGGLILLGCTSGHVYAIRASDGQLAWRFLAAPYDRLIGVHSQLESAWPVHGSVLIENGIAYCTAGRNTYLDGGIRVLALEPATGKRLNECTLSTWNAQRVDAEEKPFIPAYHIEGSRSDILVSEGGSIFMGQYKLDTQLIVQDVPYIIPEKGAEKVNAMDLTGKPYVDSKVTDTRKLEVHQRKWQEHAAPKLLAELRKKHGGFNYGHRKMGRHLFATNGFLDDSWFNRTYWMYAEDWPGFYIGHRAAKTGQLLVVGPEHTYGVQAYPNRNMQSPLFTPDTTGYLLFADKNDNEPVLSEETRETPKGWGFTRKAPPVWHNWVPIRMRAMVLAGDTLFVAGPVDELVDGDPMATFDNRKGGVLRAVSAADGKKRSEQKLDAPPVFDGLIAAKGCLYMSTTDGRVMCLGIR